MFRLFGAGKGCCKLRAPPPAPGPAKIPGPVFVRDLNRTWRHVAMVAMSRFTTGRPPLALIQIELLVSPQTLMESMYPPEIHQKST